MDRAGRSLKKYKYIGIGLIIFGIISFVVGASVPELPVPVQYLLLIIVTTGCCVSGILLIKYSKTAAHGNAEHASAEDRTENIPVSQMSSAATEHSASELASVDSTEIQSAATAEENNGSADGTSKDGNCPANSASNEESKTDGVSKEESGPVDSSSKEGLADVSKEGVGQTSASKDECKQDDGALKGPADGSQEGNMPENASKGSELVDGATKDMSGQIA